MSSYIAIGVCHVLVLLTLLATELRLRRRAAYLRAINYRGYYRPEGEEAATNE